MTKFISIIKQYTRNNTIMNFKNLYNILPIELADYIAEYHPESKIKMNTLIRELIEYHQKIEEYEAFELSESLVSDSELLLRNKLIGNIENIPCPYILNPVRYRS
jgi:hypothetical protein